MIYSVFKTYRYIAVVAAIGLLALASCKRDEPVNNTEPPVFGIKGTIGGAPVNIKAGVDSYYLYTSYYHDVAKQLYSFSGELKKANCVDCRNALKITIYDSVTNNGTNPVNMNMVLTKTDFKYASNTKPLEYKYTFYAEASGFTAPSYTWKIDTLVIGTGPIILGAFPDTSNYDVCLIVEDLSGGGCVDQRCNQVKPVADLLDTCQPNFTYGIFGDSVRYSIASTGGNYFWDFGDGKTGTNTGSFYHKYDSLKTYNVCLTRSFSGCASTICKTVKLGIIAPCVTNFVYGNPKVDSTGTIIDVSKVEITYVDANGELYNSRLQDRPPGSFFRIHSRAPYDRNEKGQNTHRIRVSFNCRVYSTTTAKFLDLVIAESDMAVAHP